jgi:hypothetical protein
MLPLRGGRGRFCLQFVKEISVGSADVLTAGFLAKTSLFCLVTADTDWQKWSETG